MRAVVLIALVTWGFGQAASAPQPSAPAAPPGTDIYLLTLANGLASMKDAKPVPVSVAPGYDNQPMFSPDSSRILFAANHDGKQTDVFVFDRAAGRVSPLTETPENENSPTFLPAGLGDPGGFSVVRTEPDKSQRLWRFDAQGRNPQIVLTDVKPVGYHAWVDKDVVALFVLGPPATLRIASVSTGKAQIIEDGIGRSLHRIPNTRLVSFVNTAASGEYVIRQIDVDSKKIEPIGKAVEGSADRDMAWMPDGRTILMSSGTKVFSWTRGAAGWTEVFDAARAGLGAVSRLAVSPTGDAIALVVAEPKR
jgi:Tol biopolymer transport system component